MADTMNRRTMIMSTGALMALAARPAFALNTADAEGFVSSLVEELRALVVNGRSGPEGAAEFLELLERRASVDAVGRFALGRNWREMSDAQKAAFGRAFRSYISNTYQNRFGDYAGEDIVVVGSVDAGKKGVLVKSSLKRPSAADVSLEWLVNDRTGAPLLADIVFEGVSLAISLRETFAGMIESRNGNIDTFIEDLGASAGA